MTPPRKPSPDALPRREWLTRDEVGFALEQSIRINNERNEPRLAKIESSQSEILLRLEDGFNRINTRLSMADVDRKHQHEQGQQQTKELIHRQAKIEKKQDEQDDKLSDVAMLKGNLEMIVGLVKFIDSIRMVGGVVRYKTFWAIVGLLLGSTPFQLWWYHAHPRPRPIAVVKEVVTHEPVDPTPVPQPTIPSAPASPAPTYAPQQQSKEKIVGK